ncbi:hypothetical protein Tco_0774662 [Tanacetum coccineum]|uniref:Uncharacterized protein n=1 Tax=Tanacetum coccineum TaxID=301880 RepID=A0ABQ4ZRP4_9ASTR
MANSQEYPNSRLGSDAEPLETLETGDSNVIPDSPDMCDNDIQDDQNDVELETGDSNVLPDLLDMCNNDIQDDQNDVECNDERVVLANLIANLKLDVDENKKIQKQLKKANSTLTQELTECKSILAKTSRTLGENIQTTNDSFAFVHELKQEMHADLKYFESLEDEIDKLESDKA